MQKLKLFSTNSLKSSTLAKSGTTVFMSLFLSVITPSVVAQTGSATNFPDRQVRIVVPFPAGGASDIVARLFAKELGESWKQTVLVENKPGASGHLGGQYVASAKP